MVPRGLRKPHEVVAGLLVQGSYSIRLLEGRLLFAGFVLKFIFRFGLSNWV